MAMKRVCDVCGQFLDELDEYVGFDACTMKDNKFTKVLMHLELCNECWAGVSNAIINCTAEMMQTAKRREQNEQ